MPQKGMMALKVKNQSAAELIDKFVGNGPWRYVKSGAQSGAQ